MIFGLRKSLDHQAFGHAMKKSVGLPVMTCKPHCALF